MHGTHCYDDLTLICGWPDEHDTCLMGHPTFNPPERWRGDECICKASCEPHLHEIDGEILCLHDGETLHRHCPEGMIAAARESV